MKHKAESFHLDAPTSNKLCNYSGIGIHRVIAVVDINFGKANQDIMTTGLCAENGPTSLLMPDLLLRSFSCSTVMDFDPQLSSFVFSCPMKPQTPQLRQRQLLHPQSHAPNFHPISASRERAALKSPRTRPKTLQLTHLLGIPGHPLVSLRQTKTPPLTTPPLRIHPSRHRHNNPHPRHRLRPPTPTRPSTAQIRVSLRKPSPSPGPQ